MHLARGAGFDAPSRPTNVAPKKWLRLERYLEALPTAAAHKLFEAIERDRVYGDAMAANDSPDAAPQNSADANAPSNKSATTRSKPAMAMGAFSDISHDATTAALPHLALLGILRGMLSERGARPPDRLSSAQRIFFTPFEDFITATRRGRKRRARFPRAALGRIWAIVEKDAACQDGARAARAFNRWLSTNNAALTEKQDAVRSSLENDLYASVAAGLKKLVTHAEADEAFRADLTERLGGGATGAAVMLDLAEFSAMLPVTAHLRAVQNVFPKPVSAVTEEQLYQLRGIYADAFRSTPDVAHYTLLCLSSRLETPWNAVRLYGHFAGVADEALTAAKQDAEYVIEAMFQDMEALARALERDAEGEFDARDAATQLRYFARFTDGVVAEARRIKDPVIANRAEASRDVAAAACERFAEQALAAIRRAQPTRHAGGSSRLMGLRPDVDRPADRAISGSACAAAKFLADVRDISRSLGRDALATGVADDAVRQVRRYANDVILEIRAAEGEDRIRAKRVMGLTLDIAMPLLPLDEVELLREKSAAAAVSA